MGEQKHNDDKEWKEAHAGLIIQGLPAPPKQPEKEDKQKSEDN
jgi:hypothetical protein